MSEIVPPEVRPKPAVPAKPSHVAPPAGASHVPLHGSGSGSQGSGGGSTLLGYVGIDTIIEQMRKKTMKTGFDFNIMVVGRSKPVVSQHPALQSDFIVVLRIGELEAIFTISPSS